MKQQWADLSEKFLLLTTREQVLIFLSGLVVFFMVPYSLSVEGNFTSIMKNEQAIDTYTRDNKNLSININEFQQALKKDPNSALRDDIASYKKRLSVVDKELLTLTSELIEPIQMRIALGRLLKVLPGVKLTSFKVVPAEPLIFSAAQENDDTKNLNKEESVELNKDVQANSKKELLGLYRHGIKIKLTGKYFQLRDYLLQIENLPWKFFWHSFNYNLDSYPMSSLEIEIYSLSTKREFVGV